MTMATLNQIFGSDSSAFLQHPQLPGDLAQPTDDFLVSPCKIKYYVRNSDVVAEVLDMLLRPAQVMSGEAREQVVHNLEIETTVYKIEPGWAVDVHCRPNHFLSK